MMALTLALLCLFTIGAGAAVARLLPPRLALFQLPTIWAKGLAGPGTVLRGATGAPSAESGGEATAAGVSASLDGLIKSGNLGSRPGALVTDLSTGQGLYQLNPNVGLAPASTTKIVTAIAALGALGPGVGVHRGGGPAGGKPEVSEERGIFLRGPVTPSRDAAPASAFFLGKEGITVRGTRSAGGPRGKGAVLAEVGSPPLAEIVQQM